MTAHFMQDAASAQSKQAAACSCVSNVSQVGENRVEKEVGKSLGSR